VCGWCTKLRQVDGRNILRRMNTKVKSVAPGEE
jgi:hypothetical protein